MKNKHIKLVSFLALVSILFLQGMWQYNTYKLLEAEFNKNISALFIQSLEKEIVLRVNDPTRKPTGKIVDGYQIENDPYINNRALQDWAYRENIHPILLEKLDSIFRENIKKDYGHLNYSFLITDSLKNQIASINQDQNNLNEHFAYKETLQLRNIAPEYITLTISSPYKIIFGEMILMLIASFVLAVIVVYGLILQVRIINRQDRIAEIRQDFTYAMIHDMRNPITTILMGVNSLKSEKIDNNPGVKEQYYRIICQESERVFNLSDKILEIAKFEGQQVALAIKEINLPDLLGNLKEKHLLSSEKKVHFHIELNGVEHIYADLHYINEAFNNLIDNAIKYSKDNEDVEINITAFLKGKDTWIIFRDNGTGISEKDQKRVFQKFERAMSVIKSQNKTSGFGLGLNFVYQVVKAHRGTVVVNSRLGSYSEFIINLPYKHENDKTVAD